VSPRVRVGALLAAGLLVGCARSVFPPGGPVDTTPPNVVVTAPADSSVQVARDAALEILFSEAMIHQTVLDGFQLYPPAGRPSFDWSGRKLRISWDQPLAESTTYIALLSASARDQRGVAMGTPLTIRFSTGDSLDHGRIGGVLRAKTLPTRLVPIWAYAESLGLHPDSTDVGPSYATETDTSGAYSLTALAVGRGGLRVFAFYDLNRNGSFESDTDLMFGYPEVIRLTPEHPVADSINIVAVDPRAPGIVTGSIASRDSTARYRIEARDAVDSSYVRHVERRGPGPYTLRVSSGAYRFRAVEMPVAEGAPERSLYHDGTLDVAAEGEYGPIDFDFMPPDTSRAAPGDSTGSGGKE
jgi:hypothetical protein